VFAGLVVVSAVKLLGPVFANCIRHQAIEKSLAGKNMFVCQLRNTLLVTLAQP